MSKTWPYKTDSELTAAGYKFDRMGTCSGANCRAAIEWWYTPNNRPMPIDPGTMQPHWATCPDADRFKKGK
jgi:hypothetical protein